MSHDSQRLEIEHVRRKVADWSPAQPGTMNLLQYLVSEWLPAAVSHLDTDAETLMERLAQHPAAVPICLFLNEEAFGVPVVGGSLYERFAQGPGRGENGLRLRYLRRLAFSAPSVWRVVRIKSGISVTLSPWDDAGAVTVHDRVHTKSLAVDDVLVTRLIEMPAGPMFSESVIRVEGVPEGGVPDSVDVAMWLLNICTLEALDPESEQTVNRDSEARAGSNAGAGRRGRASAGSDDRDDTSRSHEDDAEHRGTGRDRGHGSKPAADSAHSKVLERVRKLFALAQETEASPHEAEIALRRCQSLMTKYGITEADLETSAFGNAEITTGRTVPMHMKYLASAVSRLHDVLFVSGRGGFAEFRGFEVDASVARMTLDYLLDAVERALTDRKRSGDFPAGRSAAYDYRLAFASEVDRRVSELVAERLQEERKKAGTGTSLVVRKREIVQRECAGDLSSSTFRGREARNAEARAAGQNDGARVSLDRQVGSAPDPLALPES